jgi:hypothetical protein
MPKPFPCEREVAPIRIYLSQAINGHWGRWTKYDAKVMNFAEIWHDAQHRRTDDIASDIDNLKMIYVLSGLRLLVSVVLASCDSYLGSSVF